MHYVLLLQLSRVEQVAQNGHLIIEIQLVVVQLRGSGEVSHCAWGNELHGSVTVFKQGPDRSMLFSIYIETYQKIVVRLLLDEKYVQI